MAPICDLDKPILSRNCPCAQNLTYSTNASLIIMSYQVQIPNVRDTYFAVDRTEHYQELFWVIKYSDSQKNNLKQTFDA